MWYDRIVEYKSNTTNNETGDEQRPHKAKQRNAGGFDGYQFEGFTEVTKSHDGRQEHGQRQSQWNYGCGYISHQTRNRKKIKALAHNIINVQPEKLQHEYKQGNKKSSNERANKGF